MQKNYYKKGFTAGIIFLLIGVGIQSSLANSVSHTITSDNEEYCFECKLNDKAYLTEKLLNKVESYIETKDLIHFNNLPYDRPICKMLESIGIHYSYQFAHYTELVDNTPYGTSLYWLYVQIAMIYLSITIYIVGVGVILGCWEAPDWGPDPY